MNLVFRRPWLLLIITSISSFLYLSKIKKTMMNNSSKRSRPFTQLFNSSKPSKDQVSTSLEIQLRPVSTNEEIDVPSSDEEQPLGKKIKRPLNAYQQFMRLDQGGIATIAWYRGKEQRYVPVAMKKIQLRKELLTEFRLYSSKHMVELLDTLVTKHSLYLIYEYMDVSLRHISSIPGKPLEHSEIGAICREVYLYFNSISYKLTLF